MAHKLTWKTSSLFVSIPGRKKLISSSFAIAKAERQMNGTHEYVEWISYDLVRQGIADKKAAPFIGAQASAKSRTPQAYRVNVQSQSNISVRNNKTTPEGFEPSRAEPIGLAGRRLNHSAKVSSLHVMTRIDCFCSRKISFIGSKGFSLMSALRFS